MNGLHSGRAGGGYNVPVDFSVSLATRAGHTVDLHTICGAEPRKAWVGMPWRGI